tara:strand:+ start:667 stop:1143 length:477 start_codon:yes stop_codon:yes gene_type:complete
MKNLQLNTTNHLGIIQLAKKLNIREAGIKEAGVKFKKIKNAEFYSNMKEVILTNAQLNDKFIETFANFLVQYEENFAEEKFRRKQLEDEGENGSDLSSSDSDENECNGVNRYAPVTSIELSGNRFSKLGNAGERAKRSETNEPCDKKKCDRSVRSDDD